MKLSFLLLLAIAGILSSANELLAEHRPPLKDREILIDLGKSKEFKQGLGFNYETESVITNGSLLFDTNLTNFQIEGVYKSLQNLEPEVNLAYQIYDSKHNLLLKEGTRTPFLRTGNESTANFLYNFDIGGLAKKGALDTLIIQFNYVKEHEYWADQKFADIELPNIRITGLKYVDPISVGFSWFPHIVPAGTTTFSFHRFTIAPHLPEITQYRASVESYNLSERKRIESKRYSLDPKRIGKPNFIAAEMRIDKLGRANRRLGFVLEGVRWHNRPSGSYQSSWVLPIWLYSALAFAFLAIICFAFHFAANAKSQIIRFTSWIASIGLCGAFVFEFASPLVLVYLSIFASVVIIKNINHHPSTLYWLFVFFIITQEVMWTHMFNNHEQNLYGTAFSILLVIVFASPLMLIKRRWVAIVVGNAILITSASYYFSANLYYAFFEDYPTWNVLTYASQGLDVADSIVSLLDQRHSLAIIILASYLFAFNLKTLGKRNSHQSNSYA